MSESYEFNLSDTGEFYVTREVQRAFDDNGKVLKSVFSLRQPIPNHNTVRKRHAKCLVRLCSLYFCISYSWFR